MTILSTSFTDDSRDSIAWLSFLIRSCLTIGITTASDIEPTMAPRIKAGISSKSVSQRAIPATAPIETKKVTVARAIAPPTAERRLISSRAVPLSKRMMISVIVVNIGPTVPKFSGEVRPSTGPTQIPMMINSRTSGTLVRLKMAVKRWARKTRTPTKTITGAISCIDAVPFYF